MLTAVDPISGVNMLRMLGDPFPSSGVNMLRMLGDPFPSSGVNMLRMLGDPWTIGVFINKGYQYFFVCYLRYRILICLYIDITTKKKYKTKTIT